MNERRLSPGYEGQVLQSSISSNPSNPITLTRWHNPPESLKAHHQVPTDIFHYQIWLKRPFDVPKQLCFL